MVDGIPVYVDPRAAPWVSDSLVDYVSSFWGKGLTIRPAYGSC
jgi:Fe-S cluster assembly iron-binding protein IscA